MLPLGFRSATWKYVDDLADSTQFRRQPFHEDLDWPVENSRLATNTVHSRFVPGATGCVSVLARMLVDNRHSQTPATQDVSCHLCYLCFFVHTPCGVQFDRTFNQSVSYVPTPHGQTNFSTPFQRTALFVLSVLVITIHIRQARSILQLPLDVFRPQGVAMKDFLRGRKRSRFEGGRGSCRA